MGTPGNKLPRITVTYLPSGLGDLQAGEDSPRSSSGTLASQASAASARPALAAAENPALAGLTLDRARPGAGATELTSERRGKKIVIPPKAMTLEEFNAVPKSKRINDLVLEFEKFHAVLSELKNECEEQAEKPILASLEDNQLASKRTAVRMSLFETQVQKALEMFEPTVVSNAQITTKNKRREEIESSLWPLKACEHAGPALEHIYSMDALFTALAKINHWCGERLTQALSRYDDTKTQLLSAAKQIARVESAGVPGNTRRNTIKNNTKAVQRASTFFFNSIIPLSELAVQRANLLCVLADARPRIEALDRKQPARDTIAAHLAKKNECDAKLRAARLDEVIDVDDIDDIDDRMLLIGFDDSSSTSDQSRSDRTEHSDTPTVGSPIMGSPIAGSPIKEAQHSSPTLQAPSGDAGFPPAHALEQPPTTGKRSETSTRKSGRRASHRKSESTPSVHQPKYDSKSRYVEKLNQRKRDAQLALDSLAEDAYVKRISVLDFYNAYSNLRENVNAGWKDHLKLLDEPQFQLPELGQMRKQLQIDVHKLLNDADRAPDADHMFSDARGSEDVTLQEKARGFLTEFRAYSDSTENAAYYAYAAQQLSAITEQSMTLSHSKRKTLLLGSAIKAIDINHGTRKEALETAHEDASGNTRNRGDSASLQPQISLSADKRSVEIVDTSGSGSNLFWEGDGFRTSITRAAELLATAAIGSTRTEMKPHNLQTRPNTPISAAWMQSLANIAPHLLGTGSTLEPFNGNAIQAKVKVVEESK